MPTRGTTIASLQQAAAKTISIHVPTRGTTLRHARRARRVRHFNPRAYTRHDTQCARYWPNAANFNPRAYTRHDDQFCGIGRGNDIFQSTCLHEARHSWRKYLPQLTKISIHVPTRGTTSCWYSPVYPHFISIHVPTRGTTYVNHTYGVHSIDFNPRAYTRHDYSDFWRG